MCLTQKKDNVNTRSSSRALSAEHPCRRILEQFCLLLGLCIANILSPPTAHGNVIYEYTGPTYFFAEPPFSTAMTIRGSFELSTALSPSQPLVDFTPVHFSFTDGIRTFSDLVQLQFAIFFAGTSATGTINTWNILLVTAPLDYIHSFSLNVSGAQDQAVSSTSNNLPSHAAAFTLANAPGSWTIRSTVPEPSTSLLAILMALGGLVAGKLRERAAAAYAALTAH
jgi:hypothetical protein